MGTKKLLWVVAMFIFLIVLMVSWYICILELSQIVYFKCEVSYTSIYFNKAIFKGQE